jgi:hypothetical protein
MQHPEHCCGSHQAGAAIQATVETSWTFFFQLRFCLLQGDKLIYPVRELTLGPVRSRTRLVWASRVPLEVQNPHVGLNVLTHQ